MSCLISAIVAVAVGTTTESYGAQASVQYMKFIAFSDDIPQCVTENELVRVGGVVFFLLEKLSNCIPCIVRAVGASILRPVFDDVETAKYLRLASAEYFCRERLLVGISVSPAV